MMSGRDKLKSDTESTLQQRSHLQRVVFAVLGLTFFAVGVVGVFVPVLPTTPFMLVALWAFSLSSQRLHDYVWHHPHFGQAVRDWKTYGVIPRKAKVGALAMMALSALILALFSRMPLWGMAVAWVVMAGSAWWLWGRPEAIKNEQ